MAYIHIFTPHGRTMDARDWDRIGDLLMQIRKKWANQPIKEQHNQERMDWMLEQIQHLLALNYKFAEFDDKGWL